MLRVFPYPVITWQVDNTPISESNIEEIRDFGSFCIKSRVILHNQIQLMNVLLKIHSWSKHGQGDGRWKVGSMGLSVYVRGWEGTGIDLQGKKGT